MRAWGAEPSRGRAGRKVTGFRHSWASWVNPGAGRACGRGASVPEEETLTTVPEGRVEGEGVPARGTACAASWVGLQWASRGRDGVAGVPWPWLWAALRSQFLLRWRWRRRARPAPRAGRWVLSGERLRAGKEAGRPVECPRRGGYTGQGVPGTERGASLADTAWGFRGSRWPSTEILYAECQP